MAQHAPDSPRRIPSMHEWQPSHGDERHHVLGRFHANVGARNNIRFIGGFHDRTCHAAHIIGVEPNDSTHFRGLEPSR